jgi:hypothetical protein
MVPAPRRMETRPTRESGRQRRGARKHVPVGPREIIAPGKDGVQGSAMFWKTKNFLGRGLHTVV